MCEDCKFEETINGNGKPGLKSDMAVVKITNRIIIGMNSAILIALARF